MRNSPMVRLVLAAGLALATGSATGCKDDDSFLPVPWDDPTPPAVAPTSTATHVPQPSPTATMPAPTATATLPPPSATATTTTAPTGTPTATPTPVVSPAPTSPPATGPVITFFGLARADDTLIEPAGHDSAGVPIYTRAVGGSFRIVVEAAPGASGGLPGSRAFEPDGTTPPALQIGSSRPLGNGSPEVCDRTPPEIGGIPAIDPPTFASTPEAIAALNDFGCRFLDGAGEPRGRSSTVDSCVLMPSGSGTYAFVSPATRMQFCALVDTSFAFPPGDTLLTVRLLDGNGDPGPAAHLIVRIPG